MKQGEVYPVGSLVRIIDGPATEPHGSRVVTVETVSQPPGCEVAYVVSAPGFRSFYFHHELVPEIVAPDDYAEELAVYGYRPFGHADRIAPA